jgi:hypothetical protein
MGVDAARLREFRPAALNSLKESLEAKGDSG